MTEPVRINTRISSKANDFLDKRSEETSLSKSAIVNIAIENYMREQQIVNTMPEIMAELKKIGLLKEEN